MRKYLLLMAFYVGLFLLIVTAPNRAHGAEPNVTCVLSLSPDVEAIKVQRQRGVPYSMTRHLILTDETNRDEARWLLMAVLDSLEDGFPPQLATTLLWQLCARPVGGVPAKDAEWRQEGPIFWPLQRDNKEI
jgi:hypothetical protein